LSSEAEKEINKEYAGKPILTAEENKERLRKIKEKRLEQIDRTTEQDRKHNPEDSKMSNVDLPEYPFKDQTKKEKKEPAKTLPWE
jgi:hypothetical protein